MSEPTERFDYPAAAAWLDALSELPEVGRQAWLTELIEHYARWTLSANGTGLRPGMELTDRPRPWNQAYYALLTECAVAAGDADIDRWILPTLTSLPDEPFFDGVAIFIHDLDYAYFDERITQERTLSLRTAIAGRLVKSRGWHELRGSRSARIEMHLGPAPTTVNRFLSRVTLREISCALDGRSPLFLRRLGRTYRELLLSVFSAKSSSMAQSVRGMMCARRSLSWPAGMLHSFVSKLNSSHVACASDPRLTNSSNSTIKVCRLTGVVQT